jgi:hypothetical protein
MDRNEHEDFEKKRSELAVAGTCVRKVNICMGKGGSSTEFTEWDGTETTEEEMLGAAAKWKGGIHTNGHGGQM